MERDSQAPDLAEYFVPPSVCTQIAMSRNRYLAIRAQNHQTSSHTAGPLSRTRYARCPGGASSGGEATLVVADAIQVTSETQVDINLFER